MPDLPQLVDGDVHFVGVNSRLSPHLLPEGYVAEAINRTFEDHTIKNRWGIIEPKWGGVWNDLVNSGVYGVGGGFQDLSVGMYSISRDVGYPKDTTPFIPGRLLTGDVSWKTTSTTTPRLLFPSGTRVMSDNGHVLVVNTKGRPVAINGSGALTDPVPGTDPGALIATNGTIYPAGYSLATYDSTLSFGNIIATTHYHDSESGLAGMLVAVDTPRSDGGNGKVYFVCANSAPIEVSLNGYDFYENVKFVQCSNKVVLFRPGNSRNYIKGTSVSDVVNVLTQLTGPTKTLFSAQNHGHANFGDMVYSTVAHAAGGTGVGILAYTPYYVTRADANAFAISTSTANMLANVYVQYTGSTFPTFIKDFVNLNSATDALTGDVVSTNGIGSPPALWEVSFLVQVSGGTTFTQVAHGLAENAVVKAVGSSGTPSGITIGTNYYIKVISADTFQLATAANGAAITGINNNFWKLETSTTTAILYAGVLGTRLRLYQSQNAARNGTNPITFKPTAAVSTSRYYIELQKNNLSTGFASREADWENDATPIMMQPIDSTINGSAIGRGFMGIPRSVEITGFDADADTLTVPSHGLVTGDRIKIENKVGFNFFHGFTGATTTIPTTGISNNALTSNSHGLANGTVVVPVAGGGEGLTIGARYYVMAAQTNSFELSTTSGGTAITGITIVAPDWSFKTTADQDTEITNPDNMVFYVHSIDVNTISLHRALTGTNDSTDCLVKARRARLFIPSYTNTFALTEEGSGYQSPPSIRAVNGSTTNYTTAVSVLTEDRVTSATGTDVPASTYIVQMPNTMIDIKSSGVTPVRGNLKKIGASGRLIPAGRDGIYFQNRLLILYGPDHLAASDILDFNHYSAVQNEFKLNTNGADDVVAVYPFNATTLIIFKTESILAISGLYGDLSNASLTEITREFGCIAPLSIAGTGKDIVFLSQRGVVSLEQTELGITQSVVVPLSDPIQPFIATIDGINVNKACATYFDNRYLLSVPVKGGGGANNKTIVYNFLNRAWEGVWEGDMLVPKIWARTTIAGKQVLAWADESGFIRYFDRLAMWDRRSSGEIVHYNTSVSFRGYSGKNPDHKQWTDIGFELSTNNPEYNISVLYDGVNEFQNLSVAPETKSRTKYLKYGVPDYDPTNINDDFLTSHREDYSVRTGFKCKSKGIKVKIHQLFSHKARLKRNAAYVQPKITSSNGCVYIMSCAVKAVPFRMFGKLDS